MEIIENKALLLRTRSPDKYKVIPRSKVVESHEDGSSSVAVFWGLDEVRVLKNLGVKNLPSPITRKYTWPGRYKPMAHQIETSAFLTLHRKAFVFSEPGTGKTLSALWAADYLMQLGEVRRVLILCPLSIMQSAWMGDISNSIIHRSAIVAHHPQATRRIEMIQKNYEIVITNYEGLNLIAREVVANGKFDLVIVDEAYAQFASWSAVDLVDESRALVVTRTYSKTWSMAAARLGYLVGPKWLVEEIDAVVLPYHLDAAKQIAGALALEFTNDMNSRVREIVASRDQIESTFSALPVDFWPSGANFILFRPRSMDGRKVWSELVEKGVLIRDCSSWPGLTNCLRVTIGTPEENDLFLKSLSEVLSK